MPNWIVWNRTVYLYKKKDLALNSLQRLIHRKTQTNKQTLLSKPATGEFVYIYVCVFIVSLV